MGGDGVARHDTGRSSTATSILPQAIRISLPPTVGFLVQIVKNTSITSMIGFVELTRAGQLINNVTFQPFPVFLTVGALYFVVCYPLSQLEPGSKGGSMSVVHVDNVQKYFGALEVLNGVSLDVEQGEVVARDRPQRLGQEHDAALHQRARADPGRPASRSPATRSMRRAATCARCAARSASCSRATTSFRI